MSDPAVDRIVDAGVIAVLRGVDPPAVPDVVAAVVEGGVDVVEVTADSPAAAEVLTDLHGRFEDVLLGAGTVRDAATVGTMTDAGAAFVVSPTTDPAVIDACERRDVPVAPGAFTPTEVERADRAGADLVKVFPAATGGPGHVSALGGPLGDVPLVPTGGVGPGTAGDYIEAGAVAVGVGGAIVDHEAIAAGDFDRIRENAADVAGAVRAAQ